MLQALSATIYSDYVHYTAKVSELESYHEPCHEADHGTCHPSITSVMSLQAAQSLTSDYHVNTNDNAMTRMMTTTVMLIHTAMQTFFYTRHSQLPNFND